MQDFNLLMSALKADRNHLVDSVGGVQGRMSTSRQSQVGKIKRDAHLSNPVPKHIELV